MREIKQKKEYKVWLVINPDGTFGSNNNLRFGRWGAEFCRAELMVEHYKTFREIKHYEIVTATVSYSVPQRASRPKTLT